MQVSILKNFIILLASVQLKFECWDKDASLKDDNIGDAQAMCCTSRMPNFLGWSSWVFGRQRIPVDYAGRKETEKPKLSKFWLPRAGRLELSSKWRKKRKFQMTYWPCSAMCSQCTQLGRHFLSYLTCRLNIQAKQLDKVDTFGSAGETKVNALNDQILTWFFPLWTWRELEPKYSSRTSISISLISRTEVVKKNRNPTWKTISLPLSKLSGFISLQQKITSQAVISTVAEFSWRYLMMMLWPKTTRLEKLRFAFKL